MIAVTSYNEDWPKGFADIRACLLSELADDGVIFDVEHFGSTAVPGLVSRPVLDICIVIPESSDMPTLISGLEWLGYIHEPHQGRPGLQTFRRKGPDVPFLEHKRDFAPHHLSASVLGDPELGRLLAFRDHLLEDADARTAYAEIKIDLAPHADADGYSQAKTAFIQATLLGIAI